MAEEAAAAVPGGERETRTPAGEQLLRAGAAREGGTGWRGHPQGRWGPGMAAGRAKRRSGDSACWGGSAAGGGGAGAAPSLLRPTLSRSPTLGPRPLCSPPLSSFSSHTLLFHLPAAWATGTSSAPRRQRGSAGSGGCGIQYGGHDQAAYFGISGASQRAPWRLDRAIPAPVRKPSSERRPERRCSEAGPARLATPAPRPRSRERVLRRGGMQGTDTLSWEAFL